MKGFLREIGLRDVVVLTLPVALATVWTLGGALLDYRLARQSDDYWSRSFGLESFVDARVHAVRSLPRALFARRHLDPEAPDPGIVRLQVADADWRGITGDAQEGWSSWSEGMLVRGSGLEDVDLRKRGDTSIHWLSDKRSFTLQTDRTSLFKGHRELGFSVKDILPQHVAASLADEFGLLAPRSEVAPVFANDLFYGMFRVVELVDESFLRRAGRMPGNIYEGEVAERGERFVGLPRGLFHYPYTWTRSSVNDRPQADSTTILVEFLADLHGGSLDAHRRTMARLDRDEIARFTAYLLVVGDPYHMDNLHNQFWYEDPSMGTLHPIPWDVRLLDLGDPPIWVNHFLQRVLRDPFLVDAVLGALKEALAGDLVGEGEALLEDLGARYEPHLRFERTRARTMPDIGEPDQVLAILRGNLAILERWLGDARFAYHAAREPSGGLVVDLESRGYAGADLVSLTIEPAGISTRPVVVVDRDGDGRQGPDDPEVAGRWERAEGSLRFVPAEALPLLPAWNTDGPGIEPGRLHYRLFVRGIDGNPEIGIRPGLRARQGGADVELEPWEVGAVVAASGSFNPWRFPVPESRAHRLAGSVRLTETLRIPAGDTLYIEPGAIVSLDPDVSIVSRGPVFVTGTPERPIRFRPASPPSPWGGFALIGRGADGSRFEHVRFEGGGGATVDRIELIGMVNVHRARDVSFAHVEMADNLRSDDTFHALHAEVTLRDCRFARANGDAVDYDHSDGEIRDCVFEASRNDAIDLMTSTPRIVGNRISGSGDKGISIGEASRPTIVGNRIEDSTRGLEVKDRSEPLVVHNTITGNGVGIAGIVKNWRYGSGGWAKLVRNVLSGNETDALLDGDSRVTYGPSPAPTPGARDELEWIYARVGLRPDDRAPGVPTRWTTVADGFVLDSVVYEENFRTASDGWEPDGQHARAGIRGPVLEATAERVAATVRRPIEWDLAPGRRYELVLELAASNVRAAELRVLGGPDPVARTLPTAGDARTFEYVSLELPPGEYTALELGITPLSGPGRVDPQTGFVERADGRLLLRRLALWAFPATRPAAADAVSSAGGR